MRRGFFALPAAKAASCFSDNFLLGLSTLSILGNCDSVRGACLFRTYSSITSASAPALISACKILSDRQKIPIFLLEVKI